MSNLYFNIYIEKYVALILNVERKNYFIEFPQGNVDSPLKIDMEPLNDLQ